jgi:N-acetylglucosamine malate deacetylase 1
MYSEVDVLFVGAHPDDVELGCGGTVLKLKSLGRKVAVVDLTEGELGTRGTPETRRQEARAAAEVLGLDFRTNLNLEDGEILVDKASRTTLIRVLRACRPRVVVTHSRGGHPDHGKTATLVEEAVHHSGLSRIETGQPRFRPERIAYWLNTSQMTPPHMIVDISEFYEQKERAIRAFSSQLHNPESAEPETYLSQPDFLERIRTFNRYLGGLIRAKYGEGFLLSRIPRVEDLFEC